MQTLESLPGIGTALSSRVRLFLSALAGLEPVPENDQGFLELIRDDPYLLFNVPGIKFKRVGRILREDLGMAVRDHVLHLYGNREIALRFGPLSDADYRLARRRLGLLDPAYEHHGVVMEDGLVWHPRELGAEETIAEFLRKALAGPREGQPLSSEDLAGLERFQLNGDQLSAIRLCADPRVLFSAILGGAGTGKTLTIAALTHLLLRRGKRLLLCAFTGKSVDVMGVQLVKNGVLSAERLEVRDNRVDIATIHLALGAVAEGVFTKAELPWDYIVIEEAGQLTNQLLAEIIGRKRPECPIVCVGDPYQLRPIGYGAPFEDAVTLGAPQITLCQNYRQQHQESIYSLSQAVRLGARERFLPGPGVTFRLGGKVEESLLTAASAIKDAGASLLEWQAVCATNATRRWLNELLGSAFNPEGELVYSHREKDGRVDIRVGDRVVCLVNDHQVGVHNGELGVVVSREDPSGRVLVEIKGRLVAFPGTSLHDVLTLGYAITTYKAQGSGWRRVIMCEPGMVSFNARRWFYTSISRAEEQLDCVSLLSEDAWWNNALAPDTPRSSTLASRLKAPSSA